MVSGRGFVVIECYESFILPNDIESVFRGDSAEFT